MTYPVDLLESNEEYVTDQIRDVAGLLVKVEGDFANTVADIAHGLFSLSTDQKEITGAQLTEMLTSLVAIVEDVQVRMIQIATTIETVAAEPFAEEEIPAEQPVFAPEVPTPEVSTPEPVEAQVPPQVPPVNPTA